MSISLSTLLPGVSLGQVHARNAVSSEVQELIDEKLIGEQSRANPFYSSENMDSFDVTQWSNSHNSQWWALMGEGEVGEQAAGYLEQMLDERRDKAANYLNQFFQLAGTLAEQLQDEGAPSAEFDQILDNVAAGRSPTQLSDGSELPKADQINAFWQQNQAAIETLNQQYQALKDAPAELDDWIDQNGISRSPELNQLLGEHRYSGFNGYYEDSEALLQSSGHNLNMNAGISDLAADKADLLRPMHLFGPFAGGLGTQANADLRQHSLTVAMRLGDAGMLKNAVGTQMMNAERQQLLTEYNQIYQPVADDFYQSMQDLEPAVALQDLLESMSNNTEADLLASGEPHPQADRIQQFIDDHRFQLNAVNNSQEKLDALARTPGEWLQQAGNTQKAEQAVFQEYGLEPWESGMNARWLRPGTWTGTQEFSSAGAERQQQLVNAAQSRENHLQSAVQEALAGSDFQDFDMAQLLDNYRFNRPLAMTADGSVHPRSEAIEAMFEQNEDMFIAHIDSQWLLGKEDNLSRVDYNQWMTYDRAEGYADELLALIQQSQQVISFEQNESEDQAVT